MKNRVMSKRHSNDGYKKGSSSGSGSGSEDEDDHRQDELKRPKLSFGIGKKPDAPTNKQASAASDAAAAAKVKSIQIKFGGQTKQDKAPAAVKPLSRAVSAAFNVDDDDEVEEMPPEAKMRMRNIGRETPTSAGPNSFGKTKQGFCDAKKVFEKTLKKAMESSSEVVPGKNST